MSSAIELYNLLKDKLGDMETQALIAAINNGSGRYKDLATKTEMKEEISKLREDMAQHRAETKEEISKLKAETKEELGKVREDMINHKVDVIKWVAAMLVAQAAVIAALVRLL